MEKGQGGRHGIEVSKWPGRSQRKGYRKFVEKGIGRSQRRAQEGRREAQLKSSGMRLSSLRLEWIGCDYWLSLLCIHCAGRGGI